MTEHEAVKKCLIEIYGKNGYGDLTMLTQRDYEHVSEQIEKNTGIDQRIDPKKTSSWRIHQAAADRNA